MPYRGEPYRGQIDGLKALAVLAIVLFHYDAGLTGGFAGIDVLLVVAGFLIASSIRDEVAAGSFSFLSFYERGMRGSLPALIVLLAVVLGVGFMALQPADFAHLSKSGAAAALGAGNVFFFLDSSYFNASAARLPLLHTWALGAVEQFYVVLPLVIVALRKARPVLILAAIAMLAVASFVFSNWYLGVSQTGGYYMLPSRAWEMLAGSLLAFAPRVKLSPVVAGAVGLAGLAMIAVAFVTYNALMFYPGKKALLPVLGAMAVIYSSGAGGGIVAKALAWKPVAFVGKVSFSWYLWHWPLIAFYKYLGLDDGTFPPKLLLMAVSFGLAVASWRFIEQPVLRPGPNGHRLKPALIGLGASVALAAAFALIVVSDGLPGRGTGAVLTSHQTGHKTGHE